MLFTNTVLVLRFCCILRFPHRKHFIKASSSESLTQLYNLFMSLLAATWKLIRTPARLFKYPSGPFANIWLSPGLLPCAREASKHIRIGVLSDFGLIAPKWDKLLTWPLKLSNSCSRTSRMKPLCILYLFLVESTPVPFLIKCSFRRHHTFECDLVASLLCIP